LAVSNSSFLARDVRLTLRADPSLCQAEAARRSGVSKATVTRLLKGQLIGAGPVLRLCRWLDRDPYDYLERDLLDQGSASGCSAGTEPRA
jgi:transcriptional regulator with XRE-family HTH domain